VVAVLSVQHWTLDCLAIRHEFGARTSLSKIAAVTRETAWAEDSV